MIANFFELVKDLILRKYAFVMSNVEYLNLYSKKKDPKKVFTDQVILTAC